MSNGIIKYGASDVTSVNMAAFNFYGSVLNGFSLSCTPIAQTMRRKGGM
jgi:hypothetical protein